ncbi:biotin transporter BioY [Luteococcus peritonei]|uniref:Biotin transporter n=1 Tax=Luteococcus peritonei TaxID=88874 RepID=A0ABW4RVM4_9ACTN
MTGSSSRDLALVCSFAGLTALLGLLPALPVAWSPVPVTPQSLGPMLAGSLLGWRRALASQTIFWLLVALGLPLLSGGRGGLGVLLGPSVDFLLGYVLCAGAIGWACQRWHTERALPLLLVNLLGGVLLLDLLGALGFAAVLRTGPVASLVMAATYVPGGLLKAALATSVAVGVHRAVPGLLPAPVPAATVRLAGEAR